MWIDFKDTIKTAKLTNEQTRIVCEAVNMLGHALLNAAEKRVVEALTKR